MAKPGKSSGTPSLNVTVSLLIIVIAGVLSSGQSLSSPGTGALTENGGSSGVTSPAGGTGGSQRPAGGTGASTPAAAPTASPKPSSSSPAPAVPTLAPTAPATPAAAPIAIPVTVPAITKTSALAQLDALTVAAPATVTYSRTRFKHWVDADRDGCNTRAEVLLAETTKATTQSSTCLILTGSWYSPYDNVTLTAAGSLDVDHMVPLKEAWISGAHTWTSAQREAYANDLGTPGSLIAVSATTNRSKSDQDPHAWMPPNAAYRCTYVATWISVKARWNLSIDPAERTALLKALTACPASAITSPTR